MVRAILEAQLQRGGEVDLRRLTNDAGERPIDCVRSARNPTLLQLLDEATPISSTRQLLARSVWAQREVPPPHQILGAFGGLVAVGWGSTAQRLPCSEGRW